ncbi:MAG: hypothetical protein M5R36_18600 [Deltaproteobacteria bacterium]|nr:hypothetical protein [Deltaproteobacteria bacterium]
MHEQVRRHHLRHGKTAVKVQIAAAVIYFFCRGFWQQGSPRQDRE